MGARLADLPLGFVEIHDPAAAQVGEGIDGLIEC